MGIRTGVIGFGLAGRVFHAPFVHAARGLALMGIVQRSGDDASRAFPEAQIFRSAEDLFRSDAALVVVGTPNNTHVPLARAALLAGKHVVIDKPFAPSATEAMELEALAQKQGLLLAPFHNRRFDGDFLTVKKLVESGAIGRPVTLHSRFDRFRPSPRANTWKEAEGSENGLLMDLGPHLVDQALVLFGRPESITANVRTDRDTSSIEDAFDIVLQFVHQGRPVRVDVGSTMIAAQAQPRFLLHGTEGSFRKTGVDPQEPAILAGAQVPKQADTPDDWYTEDQAAWGTLITAPDTADPTRLHTETVPTERGDYRKFYEGIAQALTAGATPPTTPRDAIRVARLLEMARESSRTGSTLAVDAAGW